MKKTLLALTICITVLCTSGCYKFAKGYRAYYTIEGYVTDGNGDPIAADDIVLVGLDYDSKGVDLTYNVWPFDTLKTDENGHYIFKGYSNIYDGVRVTTQENLNKVSDGCTPPDGVAVGMPVIPMDWDVPYIEIPELTFSGEWTIDDENYHFRGYATVKMPEFVIGE